MRKWSQGKVICPGFHTKLLKIQNLLNPICVAISTTCNLLVPAREISLSWYWPKNCYLLFFLLPSLFLFLPSFLRFPRNEILYFTWPTIMNSLVRHSIILCFLWIILITFSSFFFPNRGVNCVPYINIFCSLGMLRVFLHLFQSRMIITGLGSEERKKKRQRKYKTFHLENYNSAFISHLYL